MVERVNLLGRQVVARPNSEAFAAQLHEAAVESLGTVGRWMGWCHSERTQEESAAWLANCTATWEAGTEYEFTLFDARGTYVGAAGLNQFNRVHNFANLGYWVRESRQREGLATEAVGLLARFGFEVLGLTRIEIVVAEGNAPSRKVAERAGARFEGLAENRLLMNGVPARAAMYSLVPRAAPPA